METKEKILKKIKELSGCQENIGNLNFSAFSDGIFSYQRYDNNNSGYQRFFNLDIISDDYFLNEETIEELLTKHRISYIEGSMCLLDLQKNTFEKMEAYRWNLNENLN